MTPWIGVDLDGTLAEDVAAIPFDFCKIGAPVPAMVERVKRWIEDGKKVKIFTARVCGLPDEERDYPQYLVDLETARFRLTLKAWLINAGLPYDLEVTALKDFGMVELWDDRAVRVIRNTGERSDYARIAPF